ncbi:MAG: peptide chain release factor-like protein [Candidatus Aenigmatarchaeota archaeon]
MPLDYYEKEQLHEKVNSLLNEKKKISKFFEKYINYEFMTASKHGGQYLHTTKSKVRAKISINDFINILERDLELPISVNQKLKIKELGKFIEAISEDERSQLKNKKLATERLLEKIYKIIEKLFPKPRIFESKESKEAKEERIKEKKIKSLKKALRKKIRRS